MYNTNLSTLLLDNLCLQKIIFDIILLYTEFTKNLIWKTFIAKHISMIVSFVSLRDNFIVSIVKV